VLYHFVITNKGAVIHEFMIIPPVQGENDTETALPKEAIDPDWGRP
jgi:hypothetical protein